MIYPLEILGNCFYVAASRLKNELLMIITNKNPKKALKFYKIKWEIETLFACPKTRGFCFEDTCLFIQLGLKNLFLCCASLFVDPIERKT